MWSTDEHRDSCETANMSYPKVTEQPNRLLNRCSLFFIEPGINSALYCEPFYCAGETWHLHNWCVYWGMHPMPMLGACSLATTYGVWYPILRNEDIVRLPSGFFWFFGKGPCLLQIFLQVPRTTASVIKSSKCVKNRIFLYFSPALFWRQSTQQLLRVSRRLRKVFNLIGSDNTYVIMTQKSQMWTMVKRLFTAAL